MTTTATSITMITATDPTTFGTEITWTWYKIEIINKDEKIQNITELKQIHTLIISIYVPNISIYMYNTYTHKPGNWFILHLHISLYGKKDEYSHWNIITCSTTILCKWFYIPDYHICEYLQ